MTGVAATGFAVGLLVGLTGMGGDLLITPLRGIMYSFSFATGIGLIPGIPIGGRFIMRIPDGFLRAGFPVLLLVGVKRA
jgi:uncharacterized membrane protein YfcA